MPELIRRKRRRGSWGDFSSLLLGLTIVGLWCDSFAWSNRQAKMINHGSCMVITWSADDSAFDAEGQEIEETPEDSGDVPVSTDPC